MSYRIVIIDDEPLIRRTLESSLLDCGYQVKNAGTIEDGLALIGSFAPHVVLLDNRLGSCLGMDYIPEIKRMDEDIVIILMTAYGSVSQAVDAMKLGADDYVQKPFDLEEIKLLIERFMEQRDSRRSLEVMKRAPKKLIGVSEDMNRIREEIEVLATNANVDLLICGETGTGKEVVVTTIHEKSSRADKPLVKINCSAIPANLMESELFGYERGAFTGAAKTKKGLMELADGGTVFLDEIGEMPLAMQAKLLTFLEDRSFKRVGGLQNIEVNVRIAAATNRNLEQEVEAGRFRADLFYRLNVLQLRIPPLRERREDIPVLCSYYLEHFNHKFNKAVKGLDKAFLDTLCSYYWKGNVRELRNIMERCVLFSRGERLTGQETGLSLIRTAEKKTSGPAYQLKDLKYGTVDLKEELSTLEKLYIDQAMDLTEGNLTQAAQLLGCSRFTLKRRLDSGENDFDL